MPGCMGSKGRPREDTGRRQPSTSQGQRLQEKPALATPRSWTSSLRNTFLPLKPLKLWYLDMAILASIYTGPTERGKQTSSVTILYIYIITEKQHEINMNMLMSHEYVEYKILT